MNRTHLKNLFYVNLTMTFVSLVYASLFLKLQILFLYLLFCIFFGMFLMKTLEKGWEWKESIRSQKRVDKDSSV